MLTITSASQPAASGAQPAVPAGPPGIYFAPVAPAPRLTVEPMDVAAFVGVAPRGPAWELTDDPALDRPGPFRARSVAVPLDRWDDYLELYGAFEGPGLLPYAVAAFFAQGGRRAYVVRVVTAAGGGQAPAGCTGFELDAAGGRCVLRLRARNEGTWGDRLAITMSFTASPLQATVLAPDQIQFGPGGAATAGTTLRISGTPGQPAALAVVSALTRAGRPADPGSDLVATLDRQVPMGPDSAFEVVEAALAVDDNDPLRLRQERHLALGLACGHPRFLPGVLTAESRLVEAVPGGTGPLLPDAGLQDLVTSRVTPGQDRSGLIALSDVFPQDSDPAGTGGVDAVRGAPEVATLVVPDLYALAVTPLRQVADDPPAASPRFRVCAPPPVTPPPPPPPSASLTGLLLDPTDPCGLAHIVDQQQQLVRFAEDVQVVALLDVPYGLRPAQVPHWRSLFDSSCAAAYHPWLRGVGPQNSLVLVPPSAVAAGLIARCELREGVSRGPANEVAGSIVTVTDLVDDQQHAELFRLGVDVYRLQTGGVYLTSARTLSMDPTWRQLSVRRLLLLIERAVRRQLQWTVFEPNGQQLRESLTRQLDTLLAALFDDGCFAGTTTQDSWFVNVASGAQLLGEADRGQLIVEVGVAPSAPIEYIIVRVAVQAEGTIRTTVTTGPAVIGHG
jgi:hypothetical protein